MARISRLCSEGAFCEDRDGRANPTKNVLLQGAFAILGEDNEVGRMDETGWAERVFRSGAELTVPRRFLVPYLTTLTGDQFKVLFAVYCQ